MAVIPYAEFTPRFEGATFIAPTAWITGNVILGRETSAFFGVVARGDINQIRVGDGSNLQENVVLHTSRGLGDCVVGANVTVGHGAILHGCKIRDHCIIGMGATILDDAEIGTYCIIGANSLVTMRTKVPDGVLAVGSPAKVIRDLTEKERKEIEESARHYRKVAAEYALKLGAWSKEP